jgi:hypothetical protein
MQHFSLSYQLGLEEGLLTVKYCKYPSQCLLYRYLQDKKQKKKRSRNYSTDADSLHQQARIGFGEVVEAPPKLSMPKREMVS